MIHHAPHLRPGGRVEADADVIIIGGGIMGLMVSYFLREQGVERVVVLERRRLGAGSTGKSGAILRQHYSHEVTIRMARESLAFFEGFQERFGHDIGFVRAGMLFISSRDGLPALERNVALQRRLGVNVDLLDADGLRTFEPRAHFDDDAVGAIEHDAAYVDPIRTLAGLHAVVTARGVDVREGVTVTDILRDDASEAWGVRIDDDRVLRAPVIVNAGGPWAGRLCRRLGVDVALTAIRPEQAFFAPPPELARDQRIYGDLQTGLYWKPEPAGWTRVGTMAYDDDAVVDDPDRYDEGVSDRFIDDCRTRLDTRLPGFNGAVSWGGCAALYTITPDAHPLIGPVPGVPGLFLASGFSGHGFKMGPAVGRGLAAMITGAAEAPFPHTFFAVDRFRRGEHVGGAYAKFGILG